MDHSPSTVFQNVPVNYPINYPIIPNDILSYIYIHIIWMTCADSQSDAAGMMGIMRKIHFMSGANFNYNDLTIDDG